MYSAKSSGSRAYHEEDNNGGNEDPGGTGFTIADLRMQTVVRAGSLQIIVAAVDKLHGSVATDAHIMNGAVVGILETVIIFSRKEFLMHHFSYWIRWVGQGSPISIPSSRD